MDACGYPGQHDAIVSRQTWDLAQSLLKRGRRRNSAQRVINPRSFLSGLVYDEAGRRMVVTMISKKSGKRYRYYQSVVPRSAAAALSRSVRAPADSLENLVIDCLLKGRPRVFIRRFDALSQNMKRRSIRAVVRRVTITEAGASISFAHEGTERFVTMPFWRRQCPVAKTVRPLESEVGQVSTTNSSLICSLAVANHWREMLECGKAQSLQDIARYEKCSVAEVKTRISLAFLPPVLVEKALEGRLPTGLDEPALLKLGAGGCWHSILSRLA
jgi:site-specific DNA recombinase